MDNGVNTYLQNRIRIYIDCFKKYEGFEEYLGGVDVEEGISWRGELCLYTTIYVRKDVDIDAFSEKSQDWVWIFMMSWAQNMRIYFLICA